MQPSEKKFQIAAKRIYPQLIEFKAGEAGKSVGDADFTIEVAAGISENRKTAGIVITVHMHHPEHKGPFGLTIKMAGEFEVIGDQAFDWERFTKVNGPAIVFPYIRELVSDLTARVGRPVILPPINLVALEKSKIQEDAQNK